MPYRHPLMVLLAGLSLLGACKKEESDPAEPMLVVRIAVDSTQARLGNAGTASPLPAGHAAQHPQFNRISAHYLELAPNATTLLGTGAVVYHAPETTAGGSNAIDFDRSSVVAPGSVFLKVPLSSISPGNYEWVRLSVSYQNYDVVFYYNNTPITGTIASFVGYNTYIRSLVLKNQSIAVNANKLQGFWGIETPFSVNTGQAPPGATTVPNPLFATSPIPQGSCVVTGKFAQALNITGNETSDVNITLSLSTNNSFEWIDSNANGLWDVDSTGAESVVDMGLRGLIPLRN
ncbi:MAG: hypothetical protein ACKOQY_05295 [Bacteroidota bacterium]